MQIYVVQTVSTVLDTLILYEQKQLSKGFVSTGWITELIWRPVLDGGSGDGECPTTECAALVVWYVQLATVCSAYLLKIGDV